MSVSLNPQALKQALADHFILIRTLLQGSQQHSSALITHQADIHKADLFLKALLKQMRQDRQDAIERACEQQKALQKAVQNEESRIDSKLSELREELSSAIQSVKQKLHTDNTQIELLHKSVRQVQKELKLVKHEQNEQCEGLEIKIMQKITEMEESSKKRLFRIDSEIGSHRISIRKGLAEQEQQEKKIRQLFTGLLSLKSKKHQLEPQDKAPSRVIVEKQEFDYLKNKLDRLSQEFIHVVEMNQLLIDSSTDKLIFNHQPSSSRLALTARLQTIENNIPLISNRLDQLQTYPEFLSAKLQAFTKSHTSQKIQCQLDHLQLQVTSLQHHNKDLTKKLDHQLQLQSQPPRKVVMQKQKEEPCRQYETRYEGLLKRVSGMEGQMQQVWNKIGQSCSSSEQLKFGQMELTRQLREAQDNILLWIKKIKQVLFDLQFNTPNRNQAPISLAKSRCLSCNKLVDQDTTHPQPPPNHLKLNLQKRLIQAVLPKLQT